ncbi:MAG: amidohydrolase family protein [Bacteroidota bacterium]
MQFLSADCIMPVNGDPCYNHVLVLADDGTILSIIEKSELKDSHYPIAEYRGILCPGFVNTHCHLELSWAKGLIREGMGLDHFVRQLEGLRKPVSTAQILSGIVEAALLMQMSGIIATADIANGNNTLTVKSRDRHYFHTFVEVFGSIPGRAAGIFENASHLKSQFVGVSGSEQVSIVPHATYSLSEELFRLLAADGRKGISSIHHQENEDENLFFLDGSGPIADRRKAFNPDLPAYMGTGKRPIESVSGYFDPNQRLLLVHNTFSGQKDIEFVRQYFSNPHWCLCPNANLYIENKLPDIELFRKNDCTITLGTDSLASNQQLSILEEIKTIQRHFPHIPLQELIRWGTLNGAAFLGLERKIGSFEKGKKPGVVLIENIDIQNLQLSPESTSRILISAGT